MAPIRIPAAALAERASAPQLARGIYEFDQYDDWLPDPVYYADKRGAAAAARLDRIWAARAVDDSGSEPLSIPHGAGKSVPALALPFEARVVAHAVVKALAPRLCERLPDDKVYGFKFKGAGAPPFFSPPGDELEEAFKQAWEAAGGSDADTTVKVYDVTSFGARATMAQLAKTLAACKAGADETEFLRRMTGARAAGLPSVDDAFAFVYNFYLRPVDQALFDADRNFFRYQDEYLLLNPEDVRFFLDKLRALLGLEAALLFEKDFDKMEEDLQADAADQSDGRAREFLARYWPGDLLAEANCDGNWNGRKKMCSEWNFVFVFERRSLQAAHTLTTGPRQQTPLDGIAIAALLQAINREREPGVLFAPPFAAAPQEFLQHSLIMKDGRAWLSNALDVGTRNGSDWQVLWAAPLLSDAGALEESEQNLLLAAANDARLGGAARAQARLALARSSSLPAEKVWAPPAPSAAGFQLRSAVLAAFHLARRGARAPWEALRQRASAAEPELTNLLSSRMGGASR